MKSILELLEEKVKVAFVEAGYEERFAMISISNRPDLCQYQCNGAMAAEKIYKKAPIDIANQVVKILEKDEDFLEVLAVKPGFINITVSGDLLVDLVSKMSVEDKFGLNPPLKEQTIIIDYGGANVGKALHVGHLRSAIIGESIKRIARFMGHKVIGDVHLGDWGLQIGLIITELKRRKPELPYFDESFTGDYPKEAPFSISDLEEIYPYASICSKEDKDYMEEAQAATAKLQEGDRACRAIWQHILNVSVADLKMNYKRLNVEFDLWKKESDAEDYIPDTINYLKENGYAYISEGALVVDVKEESDKKELPPCLIKKSDGATLYATTDIATIVERKKLFNPDSIIYVVDKRQEMHFVQVFRTVKKSKLIGEEVELDFVGFGTMNGKDGKPFKTREGGLFRLESLIKQISEDVFEKMKGRDFSEEEARCISEKVGLAAIKYGDLSNQPSKDYIFDMERFASFEGNTGPYMLYTIVRIKSLLSKYKENGGKKQQLLLDKEVSLISPSSKSEERVYLTLIKFTEMMQSAFEEKAPNRVCQFMYELAEAFNRFYHENKILGEKDALKQRSYLGLLQIVQEVMETCLDVLGLEAPDKM